MVGDLVPGTGVGDCLGQKEVARLIALVCALAASEQQERQWVEQLSGQSLRHCIGVRTEGVSGLRGTALPSASQVSGSETVRHSGIRMYGSRSKGSSLSGHSPASKLTG